MTQEEQTQEPEMLGEFNYRRAIRKMAREGETYETIMEQISEILHEDVCAIMEEVAEERTKGEGLDTIETKKYDVCDDCLLIAYDEGIKGYDAQAEFMVQIGMEAFDHECAAVDPEDGIHCDCGCSLLRGI